MLAACVLAVAGCGDRIRWINPALPESSWSGDRHSCGRMADDTAGRQLSRDLETEELARGKSTLGGGLGATFRVEDAKRYRRQLYEQCLRGRGYQKVKN